MVGGPAGATTEYDHGGAVVSAPRPQEKSGVLVQIAETDREVHHTAEGTGGAIFVVVVAHVRIPPQD